MSGLETGAAIYGLIVGTIEIIKVSKEVYSAVKDKSGIPRALRATSDKLGPLLELLEGAKENEPAEQVWVEVGKEVQRCNQACKELQELLLKAYPKEDAGSFRRFVKGTGTVVSGKGRTAEKLLKEIQECLDVLVDRQILTNADLLAKIKATIDELLPQSGYTQNNVHGDNINGDKKTYKSTGSSHMFTGDGGTYNFGVAPNESKEELWIEGLQDWLGFPEIEYRESEIKVAHQKTFRWALQPRADPDDVVAHRPNLAEWLRDYDGLFWIQGKLGSGKSTLMKYVWQSPLLQDYLDTWAAGNPLHRAAFFFTKQGASDLQKSLQGLYRTLLAHLIRSDTSLARIAFPHWRLRDACHKPMDTVLRSALSRILEHASLSQKYCFFIDGLDEYEQADPKLQVDFARDILDLAILSGVKILVASRPEASFSGRFDKCPRMCLQDLTKADIEAYVNAEVGGKIVSRLLDEDNAEGLARLGQKIVRKAKGVFLWVVLVIADLVIGIDEGESYRDLHRRLDRLDKDLHMLFRQTLLDRIRPAHRQKVARILLLTNHLPVPLPMYPIIFAVGPEVDPESISIQPDIYDVNNTRQKRKQLITHLPTHSRGLISTFDDKVTLLHSSMNEFLADPDICTILHKQAGNFNPDLAITTGLMAHLALKIDEIHEDADYLAYTTTRLIFDVIHCIEIAEYRSGIASLQSVARLEDLLEHSWECYPLPKLSSLTFEQMLSRAAKLDPQQSSETHSGLLEYACHAGFTYFLQRHIELNHGIPRTTGGPLLSYAVSKNGQWERALLNKELSWLSPHPKGDRLEPVELLLQHGADPNEIFQEATPWSHALTNIDHYAVISVYHGMLASDKGEFFLALDDAGHMLRHGADPDLEFEYSVDETDVWPRKDLGEIRNVSTHIFKDCLEQKICCKSRSLSNCSCAAARRLRPKLIELAKLVDQKKLEKRLGVLVRFGRFGILVADLRSTLLEMLAGLVQSIPLLAVVLHAVRIAVELYTRDGRTGNRNARLSPSGH